MSAGTGLRSTRPRSRSPPARRAPSSWPSWRPSTLATASRSPRPGYPAYRNILASLGCEVVELACGPEQRFQPSVDLLDDANAEGHLPAWWWLRRRIQPAPWCRHTNWPNWAALGRSHSVRLVSDEIYHGITGAESVGSCAWQQDRTAIVISSFSKYWGMTGWRLGWMLVPDDLLTPVDALAGNYALCAPVPAQHAAIEAFTERSYEEADAAVQAFADARTTLLEAVPELGWTSVAPPMERYCMPASAIGSGPLPIPSRGVRRCWRRRSRPHAGDRLRSARGWTIRPGLAVVGPGGGRPGDRPNPTISAAALSRVGDRRGKALGPTSCFPPARNVAVR